MFSTCCLTVLITGLSCGVGCNPQINYFLSTCVLCSSVGMRKAFRTLLLFYAGKACSVLMLCILTSFMQKSIWMDHLVPAAFWVNILLNLSFIIVGGVSVWKTVRTDRKSCNCHCCPEKSRFYTLTPAAVGMLYGITPCAPFLMLLGYASALSPMQSIVIGFFSTEYSD